MSTNYNLYRIVLTCWDYGMENPYSDSVAGLYSSFDEAYDVMKQCAENETNSLNEPTTPPSETEGHFKVDFHSTDHANVRLWDYIEDVEGENGYSNVTAYNIYPCTKLDQQLFGTAYAYRGFRILKSGLETPLYTVQSTENDPPLSLGTHSALNDALSIIDSHMLKVKPSKKPKSGEQNPTVTAFEKELVKRLSANHVKALTRDLNGSLFAWMDLPKKGDGIWCGDPWSRNSIPVFDKEDFPFIEWEDQQPWTIQQLLLLPEAINLLQQQTKRDLEDLSDCDLPVRLIDANQAARFVNNTWEGPNRLPFLAMLDAQPTAYYEADFNKADAIQAVLQRLDQLMQYRAADGLADEAGAFAQAIETVETRLGVKLQKTWT